MDEPAWSWGVMKISLSSLTFLAAVIICLVMTYAGGRRKALPEPMLVDFLLLSIAAGMAGGRLLYAVFFRPLYYFEQPLRLLYLQDCNFSFWGGLACAYVAVSIWAYRGNLIVERYLDAAAPALAFCLSCGYTGYELKGAPMDIPHPWAIIDEGLPRHPDGAYAIVLLMMLYLVLKLRRRRAAYEGELFVWFLCGSGVINILLDFTRDLPALWGVFTAGQLFSMVVVAFTLFFITAGPRIYISSPYLGRAAYRRRSGATALLLLWHLFLTGGLLMSYYLIHQPTFLDALFLHY